MQFGCRTLSWRENVSVLGHKTQPILQETMKGIPKLLFLKAKYQMSINPCASHGPCENGQHTKTLQKEKYTNKLVSRQQVSTCD